MDDAARINQRFRGTLPGLLGITVRELGEDWVRAEIAIESHHIAPNGYLHAGTAVALADTTAGCGCMENLPRGSTGFTTIELKSNHVGTAREGTLSCTATAAHLGRTTQVWDAHVTHAESGRSV